MKLEDTVISEEEKKKLYIYLLFAALLGGGGSTGVQMFSSSLRDDPFTGTQGQRHSDRIGINTRSTNKNTANLTSMAVRLAFIEKDYVTKDRCANTRKRIEEVEVHDEQMMDDIRTMFTVISRLPPQDLVNRVSKIELRQDFIEDEHAWMRKTLRGHRP